MQHAGCGLATFTDDDFSEELADEVGMRPPWRTHAFRDPVVSVRRDMAQLRHDPFLLPGTRVRGFVVDIETFDLEEVFVERGRPSVVRTPARRRPGDQVGSRRRVTTARWSLPGTSCTLSVSAVMPPVTSTWSICGPSHRGQRVGHVPSQSLAGLLGRVRAPGDRGAEHRVVQRGVEVARDDHRSGLPVRAPAVEGGQVAAPLRDVAGGRGDGVEGDEAHVAQPGAGHLDGRERRRPVDLHGDVAEVGRGSRP